MKTKLIFPVLLIACFSCTCNKPVSDAQKEKIQGEVKEVVNTIFKGAEEANFDVAVELCLDSPEFVYMSNGKFFTYKEFVDFMKPVANSFLNQKCTIVDEKYAFLDNSTVVYSANTKWLVNYKDGHSGLQDPWAMVFIFKKVDDRWRVIYCTESGAEKIVKASEMPKELNQVELGKKFIGTWKGEAGKDTVLTIQIRPFYDGGLITNFKIETKGNTIIEQMTLMGYDKKTDKIIESTINSYSPEITVMAAWFTSPTTAEEINFEDISNPAAASFRWSYEFKTPDNIIWTEKAANQEPKILTLNRIKK